MHCEAYSIYVGIVKHIGKATFYEGTHFQASFGNVLGTSEYVVPCQKARLAEEEVEATLLNIHAIKKMVTRGVLLLHNLGMFKILVEFWYMPSTIYTRGHHRFSCSLL